MAAVESFATKEQMASRSLGQITETSHPFLVDELKAASQAVRDLCGWHIADVATITRRVVTRHRHEIWVPARKITAVSITGRDGVEHDLDPLDFDPETGFTTWSGDVYTLTYTAGFTVVPAPVVTATLQVAARALGSPLGYTSERAGTAAVTHSQVAPGVAGGAVLLQPEIDQLAAYIVQALP